MERSGRVAWVDYGKGICIVLVVMMHSTFAVQKDIGFPGFMDYAVAFARPFRMPDFFMISGLFLSAVIDRPWRDFLDRRVVHFGYFYALWLTIEFAFRIAYFLVFSRPPSDGFSGGGPLLAEYLWGFVQPWGTLWFIYQLPIFAVAAKLLRRAPRLLVWLAAAGLHVAKIHTGWNVVDDFCMLAVFFYTGYAVAPRIFAFAAAARAHPLPALVGLLVWGCVEGWAVFTPLGPQAVLSAPLRVADYPFVSLALGLVGALAVVAVSSLLERAGRFDWVRYCGQHSLMIYLGFFLPMELARRFFVSTAVVPEIGVVSLLVTLCGVVGALAMFWVSRALGIRFLYQRPRFLRLVPPKEAAPAGPASAAGVQEAA